MRKMVKYYIVIVAVVACLSVVIAYAGPPIPIGAGNATRLQNVPVDTTAPTNGQVLQYSSSTGLYTPASTGAGDVTGPASSTDNAVPTFDGTGGKTLQNSAMTYDGANLQLTGDIGSTGTPITKGWYTDLTATNAISGDITGNSATVTNGVYTGDAGTVFLAPDGDGSGLSGVVTSESDPIVGAVTGIVKADGGGNVSAATEDTDYQGVPAEGAFADGDKTKLDGIETGADVTDATNVNAAGAVMETDLGTNVATALGVNVGSAGAFVTFDGAGGTPSSIDLSNGSAYSGDSSLTTTGTLTSGATGAGYTVDIGNSTVSGVLGSANGGTGNGYTAFTGPTAAEKTFTLPDTSATLLYSGGALGTPSNGNLTNATGYPGDSSLTTVGTLSSGDATAVVDAASTTAAGKIEIATSAETTTGTDATRAISPDGLAGSNYGIRLVGIQLTASGTTLTAGDGAAIFRVPAELNGYNLVSVGAAMYAANTTGGPVNFQIRNHTDTADMLSTALTIDDNETDSSTAATAAVINTATDDVATGDVIAIDVDDAGSDGTGGMITLGFKMP